MLGKDLIDLPLLDVVDVRNILDVAHFLKARQKQGITETVFAGKHLAMIFEKPSLRTRVSFEVGMGELGGSVLYISKDEVGLGTREPVQDVARVLSRYVSGIMIRTFAHDTVVQLAHHASVPVINGLSDDSHPCQALADMLTIEEHFGHSDKLRVVFIGDANNVSRSLARICHMLGSEFILACPEAYAFGQEDQDRFGDAWGTTIRQLHDPQQAVAGAHVLYSDVWTSMGQEAEREERLRAFAGYQINEDLLASASDDVQVMHCLPAHRDEEITDAVIEGDRSLIFDQAENRLHAQKAVMRLLMADDRDDIIAAAQAAKTHH